VRQLNGLTDLEPVFQRDDLGPDVPPPDSAFWKASLPAKAAIMSGCVPTGAHTHQDRSP
jgi:hypothetical protein